MPSSIYNSSHEIITKSNVYFKDISISETRKRNELKFTKSKGIEGEELNADLLKISHSVDEAAKYTIQNK